MADAGEPLGGVERGSPRTGARGERNVSANQPISPSLKEGIESLSKLFTPSRCQALLPCLPAIRAALGFQVEETVQQGVKAWEWVLEAAAVPGGNQGVTEQST